MATSTLSPVDVGSFWVGKRTVVTGGAGFVGSSVVDALVAGGARVRVIDRETPAGWWRLAHQGGAIERVEADLRTADLSPHFGDADAVLDFAGVAPGLMAGGSRHEFLFEENVRLADAVRSAAFAAGVPRLLVVSSSCVYPDDAAVPTAEIPLEGTEPERANAGYGAAKREIEARAIRAASAPGARTAVAIVRPFNICGPRDCASGPGAHVIPSLLGRVLDPATDEILVWGDGRQTRCFIDARDVAAAFLLALERHAVAEPVNVGGAEEVSMATLVGALIELTGAKKTVRFDPTKPVGAPRKSCDGSRLETVTGFRPRMPFGQSLREIVAARLGAAPGGRAELSVIQ